MKILVRSTYREVVAVTGRVFDAKGDVHFTFRQFQPPSAKAQFGEAYMTPDEAMYLVESDENRAHVQMGQELIYSYPAGFPVPVHDNFGGKPLHPPLNEKNFHVSDTRQTVGAEKFERERAAAMAKLNPDAAQAEATASGAAPAPEPPKVDKKAQKAAERERERLAAEAANANTDDGEDEAQAPEHRPGATTALT